MAKATRVTSVGKEKFMALVMVQRALEAYFGTHDILPEGTIEPFEGIFKVDDPEVSRAKFSLEVMGLSFLKVRHYRFIGRARVHGVLHSVILGCHIFEHNYNPRPALAVIMLHDRKKIYKTVYYEFSHFQRGLWFETQIAKSAMSPN